MAVANGFNVRVSGLNIFDHLNKNKAFVQVMFLIVVVQIAMTYIGGRVLRTAPLIASEWAVVVLISLSIIVVDLLRKIIRNQIGHDEPTNK
jgi:uncharacterized protein (DUF486 family)